MNVSGLAVSGVARLVVDLAKRAIISESIYPVKGGGSSRFVGPILVLRVHKAAA